MGAAQTREEVSPPSPLVEMRGVDLSTAATKRGVRWRVCGVATNSVNAHDDVEVWLLHVK